MPRMKPAQWPLLERGGEGMGCWCGARGWWWVWCLRWGAGVVWGCGTVLCVRIVVVDGVWCGEVWLKGGGMEVK
ncbi:hypothetical protein B484DRAFT_53748 [Ochromonadaceae sp. CCMP2298]|nr:hypothetical protein B484DRAFT_53748 [Ochromonadaceae sp. CCMP2298]